MKVVGTQILKSLQLPLLPAPAPAPHDFYLATLVIFKVGFLVCGFFFFNARTARARSKFPRAMCVWTGKYTFAQIENPSINIKIFRRDPFFPFPCDYRVVINFEVSNGLELCPIQREVTPLQSLRHYFPSVRYFFSASLTTSLLVSLAVRFASALQNKRFNHISVSHSFGQRGVSLLWRSLLVKIQHTTIAIQTQMISAEPQTRCPTVLAN